MKRASAFVGRHDCLEAACGIMRSVQAERRGHLLVIGGEAGIGKSRLLAEVLLRAAQRDFAVHLVRATDVESTSALKPAAALAASMLDLDPPSAPTGSSLDESLARLALPSTLRAPLAHLLEVPMPARDAGLWQAMDETARQRAVEFALVRLTTAAARHAALVLAVDDHHWTDELSADLLRAVALGAKTEPVLLVLSTRRGLDLETDAWSDAIGADAITELSLSPLSRDDSRRLAWSYGVDDAGFLDSCVERAQGHPFFLDQLLRHGAGAAGTLPGSIQNIVLARVDSLEPRDRAALQAAAILGHRFDLDALRATLDDPLYEPQPLIARALMSAEGDELRFAHALIRDSVSDALRTPMKRTLHQRAAAQFAGRDPAVAAGHAAAAGDPGAATRFLEAAALEASRGHFERALALAERGLACTADPPLRAELGYVAGESLLECNDAAGAEVRLREALNGTVNEELRCRIRIALAECLRLTDRQAEALAQLDDATVLAHRLEDTRLTARVELLRGNALFPLGRATECLAAYARAHALSRQVSAIELQAQALGGLGDAEYQRGRFATAHRLFGECVEVARGRHLRQVEISNLPMLAVTHAYQLELQLGAKLSDHAAELSRAIRSVRAEAIAQAVRAEIGCIAGQWNEVAAASDRCIELSRRIGARRFEADGITYSAMAMWALGSREDACRQLENALDLVRASALTYCGPIVLACLAWMSHDPRQRARALAEGRDILGRGAVSHNHLHFHAIAAEIALSERDPGQALEEAQALERYLDGEVTAWPQLVIDRTRALVRHLEGERTDALRTELAGLHSRCLTAGARPALGRLEAALGAFA
ncbi:MAG: AAA family ATPase [Betaproteobacteria bacterium]|nr:AAA family ATPase [Betaproteobacteria bacterium]